MVKGNITKSIYGYTVSIFKDSKRIFKKNYIQTLSEARSVLAAEKMRISERMDNFNLPKRLKSKIDVKNFRRSYPEFEGKSIKWKYSRYLDGMIQDTIIVGCDYDIGITIADAEDLNDNLSCYHGPSSAYRKSGKDNMSIENYEKMFIYLLTVIENNIIFDVDFVRLITDRANNVPGNGMHPCAFNV